MPRFTFLRASAIGRLRPSMLLIYDGTGYWLCLKRFSQGRISWWPTSTTQKLHPLAAQQIAVLLYNGVPTKARFAENWRQLH